jgi:hypothetical protein
METFLLKHEKKKLQEIFIVEGRNGEGGNDSQDPCYE